MMKLKLFSKNSVLNLPHARCWKLSKAFLGLLLLCSLSVLGGCTSKKVVAPFMSDTHGPAKEIRAQNAIRIIIPNITTRMVGKTFWIYAPTDKPSLMKWKASSSPDPLKNRAKYDLLYKRFFSDGFINFEYDIISKIKSDLQNNGLTEKETDSFNQLYNNLNTAITETLLDPTNPISFVVMSITDIKKGIEAKRLHFIWKITAWLQWKASS